MEHILDPIAQFVDFFGVSAEADGRHRVAGDVTQWRGDADDAGFEGADMTDGVLPPIAFSLGQDRCELDPDSGLGGILMIKADDPLFDPEGTAKFLEGLNAHAVTLVEN